jgi:tmRNA-binding protein
MKEMKTLAQNKKAYFTYQILEKFDKNYLKNYYKIDDSKSCRKT